MTMPALLFAKKGDACAQRAWEMLQAAFPGAERVEAARSETPAWDTWRQWRGKLIISYLCPWILPGWLLERATLAAINFHPGPPEYPGIGCTNFALYDEAPVFGVTCHHMAPQVDAGPIIAVRRFQVSPDDSVRSLTLRCYEHLFLLYEDVLGRLRHGDPPPEADERWTRRPYRRSELDALCRLDCNMDEREMARRIRATTYPGMPGPYIALAGRKFVLEETAP